MNEFEYNYNNNAENLENDQDAFNTGVVKIKVVGVGGGGGNAVNRMIQAGITSAEFAVVNTDKQALYMSDAHKKIQIGEKLTKGLGAGADPNIGAKAAEESKEQLKEMLKGVDLLFITAGMGGGTGTGAAPVIASLSREMGILTVAIVTKPFGFEGARRMNNALQGIDRLREYVDALLIIPNDKLMKVLPKAITVVQAFKEADEVLRKGIQGISDLIATPALINLDFADVRNIIKDTGFAHLGVGEGEGEDRAITAVQQAVQSPLLETSIVGASGVIINIMGGMDMQLEEVDIASNLVHSVVDPSANIIVGAGIDDKLEGKMVITLIATGFSGKDTVNNDAASNDMQERLNRLKKKTEVEKVEQKPMFTPYNNGMANMGGMQNMNNMQQPMQQGMPNINPNINNMNGMNNMSGMQQQSIPQQRPVENSRMNNERDGELPAFIRRLKENRNNN